MAVDVLTPTAWAYAPITKIQDEPDGSVRVYGRPTHEVLDVDQQIADKAWVKEALPEWFQTGGNVREMHQPKAIGKGEKLEFDADDNPWLTARIVEPGAVKLVKEGVLQGFSIGIKDPVITHDQAARNGRIVGGKIVEVSAVDRPAVPTARYELVKMTTRGDWWHVPSGVFLGKTNPTDGTELNPADFDADGNPVQQPGHLKGPGDAPASAEPEIISQDTHTVTVRIGSDVYQVPIDMDSAGNVVVGAAEKIPGIQPAEGTPMGSEAALPGSSMKGATTTGRSERSAEQISRGAEEHLDRHCRDRDCWHYTRATYPDRVIVSHQDGRLQAVPLTDDAYGDPYDVEERYARVDRDDKAAHATITHAVQALGKAVWSTAYVDALPDSAFAYVGPGGEKDDRHLPYKDAEGHIDAAHVRNALARLDQTDISDAAKAQARRTLEAAAKEVGITVSEKTVRHEDAEDREEARHAEAMDRLQREAEAAEKAAAVSAAQARKVLCQTCRKSVALVKSVEATALGTTGYKVTGTATCGHGVAAFVKADHVRKSAETDAAKCDCGKAVVHAPDHHGCRCEDGHVVACAEDKCAECGGRGVDHAATCSRKTAAKSTGPEDTDVDPDREGGDDEDPATEQMDAFLEKKFAAWARKMGFKVANDRDAELAEANATRARRIRDLRDAHRALGDRIEEYAAKDLADHVEDKLHGDPTGKATQPNGGPARVRFDDPREIVREMKRHLKDMVRLVSEGDEDLGRATEDLGDPDGHLTEDEGSGIPPKRKPRGDGRLNLTAGDGKGVTADAIKAAVRDAVQASVAKSALPTADTAKMVAEAVKGVLEPLAQRLEKVEHLAQPSPFLVAAEQHYALNPTDEKAATAQAALTEQLNKLAPGERDKVFAAAIAKHRGWSA